MAEASAQWSELVQGPQRARRSIDDELADGELAACELERSLSGNGNGNNGRKLCECAETNLRGVRYPLHRAQDCEYAQLRSSLVAQAAKIATRRARRKLHDGSNGDGQKGDYWTKCFSEEVDRASRELGL